jgi:hypothetical protein
MIQMEHVAHGRITVVGGVFDAFFVLPIGKFRLRMSQGNLSPLEVPAARLSYDVAALAALDLDENWRFEGLVGPHSIELLTDIHGNKVKINGPIDQPIGNKLEFKGEGRFERDES